MFGKNNNAINRMYLAGLQAQSSVYGATIPVIYGRTRAAILQTWLHDLREGNSNKKAKKKGVKTYVENTDFLIGHNPIAGVLQFWNGQAKLALDFAKYTVAVPTRSPPNARNPFVTVPDADFYFVIGVTADVTYSETFDDYGSQGPVTYTGTMEFPLWNVNYAGPDPTSQTGYRVWPAVCQWVPYSGPTIHFPGIYDLDNWTGTVNVYYAKLTAVEARSKIKNGGGPPVTQMRMQFEPTLGDGTEYADSSAPGDQILYPPYAGLGSDDLDLGASGQAPSILVESMGSFPVNPTGDADHADMIEDIFRSGPAQAGTGNALAYGDIHHGLGCLDFPGTVQKKIQGGGVEPWQNNYTFDLPNNEGNFLFVLMVQQDTGGSPIGISDTAGNTWTALMPASSESQLWYCVSNNYAASHTTLNTVTFTNYNRYLQIVMLEVAGLDTIDGTPTFATGSGVIPEQSIISTVKPGEDALLLSFVTCDVGSGPVQNPPFHWQQIATLPGFGPSNSIEVAQYRTKFPGTYKVSYPLTSALGTWFTVSLALKNSQPNSFTSPLGNILDDTTMQTARAAARAYGLIGSLVMDSQKKAQVWLEECYRAMNAAPVWSGFSLKSIPYAEASFVGNGAIYTSPTAAGPIANMQERDFVAEAGSVPVTVTRVAQVDTPNLQQIQSPNRDSDYNVTVTSQPDNGSMSLYGTRKEAPKVFASIQTTVVARALLGIMVREANMVRNTYSFKLQPNWGLLEAMDLITIPIQSTMPAAIPGRPVSGTIAVRLTKVEIGDDFTVQCEAEPFVYGMRTPQTLPVTAQTPYAPSFNEDPGDVNPPVIFEAVPTLAGKTNIGELDLVISGGSALIDAVINNGGTSGFAVNDTLSVNGGRVLAVVKVTSVAAGVITGIEITTPGSGYATGTAVGLTRLTGSGVGSPTADLTVAGSSYGGCVAYISTDGGSSYQQLGPNGGVVQGNGTTGYTVGDWPAHADPDTVDDLDLDLTDCQGVLDSFTAADRDNFVYPCYVGGGGLSPMTPITYELMAYDIANLTAPYMYTLPATGGGTNKLRRAVWGAPQAGGAGVDHPSGSRFAFLDPNNPIAPGILRVPMDPSWIGITLHFKFTSFNAVGGGVQALADVTDYTYAPTGAAGAVNPNGITPVVGLVNGT